MSRLSTIAGVAVAAASIASLAPVGPVAAGDDARAATSELAVAATDDARALTPIGSAVAAQLYWWCLDQPRPTACG